MNQSRPPLEIPAICCGPSPYLHAVVSLPRIWVTAILSKFTRPTLLLANSLITHYSVIAVVSVEFPHRIMSSQRFIRSLDYVNRQSNSTRIFSHDPSSLPHTLAQGHRSVS